MFTNKTKKLALNKETIRALSGTEMQGVVGSMLANRTHGCTCTFKCNAPMLVCPKKVGVVGYA